MRKHLERTALLKMVDLGCQVIALVTTICFLPDLGPFALYIMGAVQFLSAMCWLLPRDLPIPRFRVPVSPVFGITGAIVATAALTLPFTRDPFDGAFGLVSIFLLYAGPVLGVWYFVVTLREIFWYRKAALPAYQ